MGNFSKRLFTLLLFLTMSISFSDVPKETQYSISITSTKKTFISGAYGVWDESGKKKIKVGSFSGLTPQLVKLLVSPQSAGITGSIGSPDGVKIDFKVLSNGEICDSGWVEGYGDVWVMFGCSK